MPFNYSKLRGRIREKDLSQEQLANAIGINKGSLSSKLNGQYAFTTKEIDAICKTLDISNNEIGDYFFAK